MNRKAFDIALRTSAALAAMVMASVPCAAGADGTKVPDVWPLQKQIDEIAESGGGTLTLTAGVYRTGAIFFKPGVNLHLEKGATILGVDEAEGYPKRETRIEGRTRIHYPALVNAYHCDGFKISGEGVIDGRCDHNDKLIDFTTPFEMQIGDYTIYHSGDCGRHDKLREARMAGGPSRHSTATTGSASCRARVSPSSWRRHAERTI